MGLTFQNKPTKEEIITALRESIDPEEQDLEAFIKYVELDDYNEYLVEVIENKGKT